MTTTLTAANELNSLMGQVISLNATEAELLVQDIVDLVQGVDIPLDELVEIRNQLQEIHQEIQPVGTTLEEHKTKLEALIQRIKRFVKDDTDYLVLNSEIEPGLTLEDFEE
jgi:uncharacterized coiled-coil DUF342 family protein